MEYIYKNIKYEKGGTIISLKNWQISRRQNDFAHLDGQV